MGTHERPKRHQLGKPREGESRSDDAIFRVGIIPGELGAYYWCFLRHYLRFSAADRTGILAAVTQLISKHDISISSVHQEDNTLTESDVVKKFVPIVIVTHEAPEGAVQTAIKESRRIRASPVPPSI